MVAPAGFGKTYLLAECARLSTGRRCLILTHTNAGVAALRSRLREFGISSSQVSVTTIDSFCLTLTRAYPGISGFDAESFSDQDWPDVHRACKAALQAKAIGRMVARSFDDVYVDEYQDCSKSQHQVMLGLAELMPVRVVGDPMQQIFGFGGQVVVVWEEDVVPAFETVDPLTTPWRWKKSNPELGAWIREARQALEAGEPIAYSKAVDRLTPGRNGADALRYRHCGKGERLVGIAKWPQECEAAARNLKGRFDAMEPVNSEVVEEFVESYSASSGYERAAFLLEFAKKCASGLSQIDRIIARVKEGSVRSKRRAGALDPVWNAVEEVAVKDEYRSAQQLLEVVFGLPGAHCFRKEVMRTVRILLREAATDPSATLPSILERLRIVSAKAGWRPSRLVVSRPVLIKGLEYEHAVVLKTDGMTPEEAYVSISRGSKSLGIVADEDALFVPRSLPKPKQMTLDCAL